MDLLRARDPILFYDEMVLYEDELDDNGVSILSLKVVSAYFKRYLQGTE